MSIFNKIREWFGSKKLVPDLIYSKPDKDGLVIVTSEAVPGKKVKLQTFSNTQIARLQLFEQGHSTEEVDGIMKKRKRDKALKDILK